MARRSLAAGWAAAPPAAPAGAVTSAPRIGSATHSAMNSTFFIAPQCSSKGRPRHEGRGSDLAGQESDCSARKKGKEPLAPSPGSEEQTDLLADRRAENVRRAGRVGT